MIEFRNVTKEFDGKKALDLISFCIKSGSACGYIGPNGAGKTTTARILTGLEQATSGEVIVLGQKLNSRRSDLRSKVGYIPESPRLYDALTPAETILMASLLRNYDKKKALAKFATLAEIFLFKEFLQIPVQNLSKGTKQKVVICLAMLFDPKVIVMDEPTDGLDVQSVFALKRLIKAFTNRGGAVFYSSHLLDVVESVCDQVLFIDNGRLAGEFAAENFVNNRGFLEDMFTKHVNTQIDLVDAFFDADI